MQERNILFRFLLDVKDNPDSGVAERHKRLGTGVRQGQKLKAGLVRDDMIEKYEKRSPTGRIRVIRYIRRCSKLFRYRNGGASKTLDSP